MIDDLKLVTWPNQILTKPAENFNFDDPPVNPTELAMKMLDVMREHHGYGLSACQVGLPWAVFVMAGQPNYACFNPKIVHLSDEEIELEEGCLSLPGLSHKITRPRHVRLRWTAPNGQVMTNRFTGMTARVIQHEMDHLEGKLFVDNMSRVKKDMMMKKYSKLLKHGLRKREPSFLDYAAASQMLQAGLSK